MRSRTLIPAELLLALEVNAPAPLFHYVARACDRTGLAQTTFRFPFTDGRVPTRAFLFHEVRRFFSERREQIALLGSIRVDHHSPIVEIFHQNCSFPTTPSGQQ
jgi:hypothetical protein